MVDINDQTEKAFSLDAFLGLDKPVNKVGGVSTKSAPKPVNAPVAKQSFKLTKEDRSLLLDFVPVVGDIKGAYETVDMISSELEKENPNYFLIGILGGVGAVATIIGLVPGAGDVAQKALMAGARSVASGAKAAGRGVVDLAQRVEVDPNAMGSMGGNIKFTPKVADTNTYKFTTTLTEPSRTQAGVTKMGKGLPFDVEVKANSLEEARKLLSKNPQILKKKEKILSNIPEGSNSGVSPRLAIKEVVQTGFSKSDAEKVGFNSVDEEMLSVFPPAENAARTQIAGTLPTYKKADTLLSDLSGEGKTLDFGAGLGLSKKELNFDTYEPFPKGDFTPDFNNSSDIPSNSYKKVTNLNVLNVVPRKVRDTIVQDIGRVLEPDGRAVITTRGRDVMDAKGTVGPEPMSIITSRDTYQKGFTQPELNSYITETLGEEFTVTNNNLGAAGVTVHKLPTQKFNEGGIVMDDKNKYPDAAVVDKDNQEIGFSLGGNLFLNEQGENSLRKSSLDIPEGEKVSTKEGSMFTRFSLGSDLDNFIIDMSDKLGDKVDLDLESAALRYKIGDNSNIYIENIGSDAPSIGYRFSKRFNEGGLNMSEEDQMQDMLVSNPEEGVAETVDPVSGNDVPPGSLPEEVRDDVPAQLSEGEYVVPADVVRYFGVKAFEDMRMEAKQGMSQMDAEGRIGGAPMQEEALPFSDEELMTVDSPEDNTMAMMNEGGVVYAQEGTIMDSTYSGNFTQDPNDPTQVVMGLQGGIGGSGYEYKTYYNAAGMTTIVPFFNGVIQGMIPEGYSAEAPKEEVKEVKLGKSSRDGILSSSIMREQKRENKVDYSKVTDPDELSDGISNYYSKPSALAASVASKIGGGAFSSNIASEREKQLEALRSAANNMALPERKRLFLELEDSKEGQAARDEAADSRGGFLSSLGDFLGITDSKFGIQDEKNYPKKRTPLMYKPRENAKNLSKKELERYDKAVRSGDDDAIRRTDAIAALRARQDGYAKANLAAGRKDPSTWTGGGSLTYHSREQAKKYRGSLHSAIKNGNAVKEGKGGFFSKYVYKPKKVPTPKKTPTPKEEDNKPTGTSRF